MQHCFAPSSVKVCKSLAVIQLFIFSGGERLSLTNKLLNGNAQAGQKVSSTTPSRLQSSTDRPTASQREWHSPTELLLGHMYGKDATTTAPLGETFIIIRHQRGSVIKVMNRRRGQRKSVAIEARLGNISINTTFMRRPRVCVGVAVVMMAATGTQTLESRAKNHNLSAGSEGTRFIESSL